jgi:hypothetical protein
VLVVTGRGVGMASGAAVTVSAVVVGVVVVLE